MLALLLPLAIADTIAVSPTIEAKKGNDFYVVQRAPLAPSPFQKLPTGSIRAKGWLLTQLKLQRDGFSGQLPKLSAFLNPNDNAWLGETSNARAGWEEVPYWLKGQVSLAYVLDDKELKEEAQKWIEGVIASQKEDGWFGPEANRKTRLGTPDLWPNMIMQAVLQTYYDSTGDQRILNLMRRYVDYLDSLPDKDLIDPRHYWHYHRVGDQLSSLIWLYNNTGYPKILEVARKLHAKSSNWVGGIANYHGVNFAQGFREPALYSIFSKDAKDRAASQKDLDAFRAKFGLPAGLYGADENAREGKNDPRQAVESCTVVEMMLSDEQLLITTGDPIWAERAEEVAFNWMPTTMTADLKALRYLTGGNHAVSDAPSKSPGIENGGPMYLMDPWDHRCCQHNIGHGWPYLTEHLWAARDGNGLAALIYAPSTVTAKVGDGTKTTIETKTNYPFSDQFTFAVSPVKPVKFPLTFRIPSWTSKPTLAINGKAVGISMKPGQFATIERTWKQGDSVTLRFPMSIRTQAGNQRPGTVTVSRGPLTYSLKVQEDTKRVGRTEEWPSLEILPTSAWNYGLVPEAKFEFKEAKGQTPDQPWTFDKAPVSITTYGRRIPEWTLDMYGLAAPLQKSPAMSSQPIEKLTLIPMGAARLRITVFPTVTPTGSKWTTPKMPAKSLPATYSHKFGGDTESALSDKLIPTSSHDEDIPRFTWWDHKGTEEWVQYSFPDTRTFQKCRVYWFDDVPGGGCRVPESWKIQVKVGDKWEDVVADSYPVVEDGWSEVSFRPIGGKEIRLVAKLKEGFSAGILEWEVN